VALIDPPEKWLGKRPPDHMAVDSAGKPLPYAPAEVRLITERMIRDGEIVAVIAQVGDDLAVQVFGPPSQQLVDVLQTAADAYRRVVRGEG
jgi:hypothetical protein